MRTPSQQQFIYQTLKVSAWLSVLWVFGIVCWATAEGVLKYREGSAELEEMQVEVAELREAADADTFLPTRSRLRAASRELEKNALSIHPLNSGLAVGLERLWLGVTPLMVGILALWLRRFMALGLPQGEPEKTQDEPKSE